MKIRKVLVAIAAVGLVAVTGCAAENVDNAEASDQDAATGETTEALSGGGGTVLRPPGFSACERFCQELVCDDQPPDDPNGLIKCRYVWYCC